MLNQIKFNKYLSNLEKEYQAKFRTSFKVYNSGKKYFPNKISNPARFFKPFPICVKSANGSMIKTVDGKDLIDFWQGHFCNILGHNPPIIQEKIKKLFDKGLGLQSGLYTKLESELASLLYKITKLDSYIFTTAGGLSTMYAIMLGLAYSGRDKVLKVGGSWHGAHPWSFKGVKYPEGINKTILEGAGISKSLAEQTITVSFDDIGALEEVFKKYGNELGVFIVELVLGNSGMIMASRAWVNRIRELTAKYGVVLIIDEMVTGFRVHLGGLYKLYGIEPDLVCFGKAVTGGMPFACIAGKKEIIDMAAASQKVRVWADSGTFISHPATLSAVIEMINFLNDNKDKVYPKIIKQMDHLRANLKEIFAKNNINVHITGESKDKNMPNFPISTIRFIKDKKLYDYNNALSHWDNKTTDILMRDFACKLSLILKGTHCWQGLGVMTFSHSDEQIKKCLKSYKEFALEISAIF